ncbi:MAG: hypothetical protein V4760_12205 [Bdellovibrionota bacterium]
MINRIFGSLMAFALVAFGLMAPANAQENATTVTGELPRTMAAPIRIIPVAGASSFARSQDIKTDRFDDGFSMGLLADFGSSWLTFETGILSLQSRGVTSDNNTSAAVDVDSWGIPLLAKMNFSGKPHETVFLKAGVMPFRTGGDVEDTDIMGVAGIGGAIPLGRNSSLQLDAAFNRSFTTGGDLTDYQGLSLLAGLAFNL